MGLNDNIYNISKSIVSKQQEQKELKQQKEFTKLLQNTLKQYLLNELIEAYKNNDNIYINNFKNNIIAIVIEDYTATASIEWQQVFNKKYKKDIEAFLNQNYFTLCGQAERIAKKQIANNSDDYKKQIAIEKWELQRQKIQLQIEKEKQKNNAKQQKEAEKIKAQKAIQTQKATATTCIILLTLFKIFMCIAIAPIFIIGHLFIGFLGRYDEKIKEGKTFFFYCIVLSLHKRP